MRTVWWTRGERSTREPATPPRLLRPLWSPLGLPSFPAQFTGDTSPASGPCRPGQDLGRHRGVTRACLQVSTHVRSRGDVFRHANHPFGHCVLRGGGSTSSDGLLPFVPSPHFESMGDTNSRHLPSQRSWRHIPAYVSSGDPSGDGCSRRLRSFDLWAPPALRARRRRHPHSFEPHPGSRHPGGGHRRTPLANDSDDQHVGVLVQLRGACSHPGEEAGSVRRDTMRTRDTVSRPVNNGDRPPFRPTVSAGQAYEDARVGALYPYVVGDYTGYLGSDEGVGVFFSFRFFQVEEGTTNDWLLGTGAINPTFSDAFLHFDGGTVNNLVILGSPYVWSCIVSFIPHSDGTWRSHLTAVFGTPPFPITTNTGVLNIRYLGRYDLLRNKLYETTSPPSGPVIPWTTEPPALFLRHWVYSDGRAGNWTSPAVRSLWSPSGISSPPAEWQGNGRVLSNIPS